MATLADPEPAPGEVVIEVAAAGLNFADILMCQGRYQERPPVPVHARPRARGHRRSPSATAWPASHPVTGSPRSPPAPPATTIGGALAEQVAVGAESVVPIPPTMSFTAAAALLINYGTGWYALHDRAAIAAGEWLLVHAGAGGVGSAAIQLGARRGRPRDRDRGRRRQGRVVP